MRIFISAFRREPSFPVYGFLAVFAGGCWMLAPRGDLAAWSVGIAALGLAFLAPAWALALWAFIAPLEQPAWIPGWGTVYTSELLLLAIGAGGAWHLSRRPGWRRGAAPVESYFFPFLAALLVSLGLAATPAACKGALRWMEFVAALVLASHLLRRGEDAERVLWALVCSGAVCAVQGLRETLTPAGWRPDLPSLAASFGEVIRAGAGFGPSTLAMYLALLLPFAVAAAWFHPRGLGRCAGLLAGAFFLPALWATFSFAGILAAGVACATVFFWFWARGKQAFWVRILLLAALLGLAALAVGLGSGPDFWRTKLLSSQDRWEYAAVVGRFFLQAPWFGIGPGEYRFLAPLSGAGANPIGLITHPHSLYLGVLAELGSAGLAGLVWAGLRLAGLAIRRIQKLARPWPLAGGVALLAGAAGNAAANLVEHGLVHDRGVHLALYLGAALVWIRRPPRPRRLQSTGGFEESWKRLLHSTAPDAWKAEVSSRRASRSPLLEILNRALAGKKAPAVLELGCGPALDSLAISSPGARMIAVDQSPAALRLAAEAGRALGKEFRLLRADARRTGLPSGEFDLVFSQGLLEHFPDPAPLWDEMARLVKPGGALVVDVPQAFHPYTLTKTWRQWMRTWPWGWETQYRAADLRAAGEERGLRWVRARGYGVWGGRLDYTAWLRRVLEARSPRVWDWLEIHWGEHWLMNVIGVFEKPALGQGTGGA